MTGNSSSKDCQKVQRCWIQRRQVCSLQKCSDISNHLAFASVVPYGCSYSSPSLSFSIAKRFAGGPPRTYSEESLLLISLLRTLWHLSYQDMHDWLKSWPALALACGLPLDEEGQPRILSPSQHCKHRHATGVPLHESLFVLAVLQAIRSRLIGARDLIIDSAPILAWRHRDPDAAFGHAPAHHPLPLLRGFRVHTLICRGSGLPLFFLLSPANSHSELSPSCFRRDRADLSVWHESLLLYAIKQSASRKGPAHYSEQ